MLLNFSIRVVKYITLAIFLLVYTPANVEPFQITRKQRDEFLNPLCSPSNKSGQQLQGISCNGESCGRFNAVCLVGTNCSWCQCEEKLNTYKTGSERLEGRCINGKKIMFQSVHPENLFRIKAWNKKLRNNVCVSSERRQNGVQMVKCNQQDLGMLWLWTTKDRLLNIETLKCLTINKLNKKTTTMPCSLDNKTHQQKIACNNKKWVEGYAFLLKVDQSFLWWSGSDLIVTNRTTNDWRNFTQVMGEVCKHSVYKGCYRFSDGSFMQLVSTKNCDDNDTCFTQHISAPIFVENEICNVEWKTSQYMASDGTWQNVKDDQNYLKIVKAHESLGQIKVQMQRKSLNAWNGSLLWLDVSCKANDERSMEQHCVLLKFETIEGRPTQPPASKALGSSSDNTLIITVIVALLVIIISLVWAGIMFRRRRQKRNSQARSPAEEMRNLDRQNAQSSTSNPIEVKASKNIRTNHLHGKNDEDGQQGACAVMEDEYSYASSSELVNALPHRPLPFVPSMADYQTIDGPITDDNPRLVYETLCEDPKPVNAGKEPVSDGDELDIDTEKPVYQTLEDSGPGIVNYGQDAPEKSRPPKTAPLLYEALWDDHEESGTREGYEALVGIEGTANTRDPVADDLYDCIDQEDTKMKECCENDYSYAKNDDQGKDEVSEGDYSYVTNDRTRSIAQLLAQSDTGEQCDQPFYATLDNPNDENDNAEI